MLAYCFFSNLGRSLSRTNLKSAASHLVKTSLGPGSEVYNKLVVDAQLKPKSRDRSDAGRATDQAKTLPKCFLLERQGRNVRLDSHHDGVKVDSSLPEHSVTFDHQGHSCQFYTGLTPVSVQS